MAANQVDFKILPSDQFSVYSPQTRSDKVITYFTLLSKLRGDILSVGQDDDPNDIVSAFYINTGNVQTLHLVKADGSEVTASNSFAGTVTSVDMSVPTGFSISGNPITTSGTLAVGFASGYSLPTDAIQATWTTAYDRSLTAAAVTGTSTKTLTLTQQDTNLITATWTDLGLTSVGLTMPAAFSVANSPLTANGTLAVTAAGLSSQYIRGDGQLANFPTPGGGGSSVNYYLNGSVNQGTFGGVTYYELSKTPIAGAGTNFTRAHASGDGYVASFITDANDPDQINIPGGNFNLEFYFNSSSSGGSPAFYGELYKVSTLNVFTLIASGSANPESITGGTTVDQYYTSIAVPQTALLSTDRLAVRVYVIVSGRNITLHTENSNFSEVITTFSTGLNSLNGLSDQVQYFAVGTSGTDFAISSSLDTHTFNLPTASATNRGALSSADWTTFNSKEPALTKGNLTEATSAVLTITGGTGAVIGTGTTIQVAQSGVSTSGFLSSTDWNTFNGKQNAITLTTTGTTGAATLIGATLNIPSYADQFVGTVTSVAALTLGTTGTDLSSTVANGTTTPVITLNVPTASAANRGALSSADWTTFNSKQGTITLTTTGSTGAATFISNTLNIPNYADQFVGTVTSVNMSVPTGFAISGNPITTSGTLAVAFAAGYSLPTDASQATWNTAYNDSITAFAYNTSTGVLTLTQQDAGTLTATVTLQPFSTTNLAEGTNLYYTDTRARLALSAGTGISYDSATGVITNSAPDLTVVLTGGTGISTSGTYPSFTITNTAPDQVVALTGAGTTTISGTYPSFTITSSDQYVGTVTSVDLTASTGISVSGGPITSSGSITVTNTAPDQVVVVTAGTGISTSGTYPSFTVTNSAPDQTVVLTAGTGITTSGTYPSFTITNSLPDQTVVLTGGTGITTSGTYPSFTVTNSDRGSSQNIFKNIAVAGQSTIVADVNDDTLTVVAGSGVTITTNDTTDTITISATGSGGSVTSVGTTAPITGGTITTTGTIGITQSGAAADGYLSSTDWGTFNSKQPQLNGTGFVKASGTTISYDNNTYYLASNPSGFTSNTGTVTSVGLTGGTGISISGGPITTSGSITVTNSAPDQTVALTAGTGISVSGTYPSFTITNTSAGGGTITGSGTTNYVSKFTSGSAIGNSQIFDDGTNVGIGTTTAPGQKLQVDGNLLVNAGTSAAAYRDIMMGGIGGWATGESHGIDTVYSSAVSPITFSRIESHFDGTNGKMRFRNLFNASAPRTDILMTIQGDGNVGIGTDSPSSVLSVTGSNTGSVPLVNLTASGSGAFQRGVRLLNSGMVAADSIMYAAGRSDNAKNMGQFYFTFAGDGSNSNRISMGLHSVDDVLNIMGTGNVGIGTTAPTGTYGKLSVAGGISILNDNNAKLEIGRYSSGTSNSYIKLGANSNSLRITNNTDLADIFTIENGGNVGIGTTNPSAGKLEVHYTGDVPYILMNTTDTTNKRVRLQFTQGGNSGMEIGTDYSVNNGNNFYFYDRVNGATLGFISGTTTWFNGNFGIGTTNPLSLLHVAGDTRITSGSLGVGVAPNATDGRIDASNDIVAFSSSDLRLKENIKPIENALEKVKSLTGVEFDWKPELKHAHGYEGHDTGVIAQEVQEVMPTAIRTNDTGYLAVRYEKLIGLLIEANKELAARVEELESKFK